MKIVRQILQWFDKWYRIIFTKKPLKATDVLNEYVCVKYKDQWINLRKSEINLWNKMARSDRRAMAMRFKQLVKKGHLKFVKINGQMTCIKNKDYESKADIR